MPQAAGTNHKRMIVVVDDEEMVLTSIRSLLHLETDYKVDCFTEPERAVDQVRQNGADLVIADYLMKSMDGIQFLGKIRELNPEATRILLTGYADKESAVFAINTVGLFQYIEKPWDNDELLLALRNGLERNAL